MSFLVYLKGHSFISDSQSTSGENILVEANPNQRKSSSGMSDRKPAGRRNGAQSAGTGRTGSGAHSNSRSSRGGNGKPGERSQRPSSGARPRSGGQSSGSNKSRGGGTSARGRSNGQSAGNYKPRNQSGSYKPKSGQSRDGKSGKSKPGSIQVKTTDASSYGRRYKGTTTRGAAASRRYSPNRQKNRNQPKAAMHRQTMLNTHRLNPFKYDMNEILSASSMDPSMAISFLASVIAKASRISTRDAKTYVRENLDEGYLTKSESDRICKLLDKYSKYR